MLAITNMTLGTLITMSASSWLTAWLGMELNLMSFLPLLKSSNNSFSSESSMKYYLIQATTSSLLILMVMTPSCFNISSTPFFTSSILFTILAMKIASAPLHFWLPSLIETLSWPSIFLILTWQKIAPLSLIYMLLYNSIIFIVISLIIGPIMMINQTSIKKLMSFSSITHLAWIMSSMNSNLYISISYFLTYSISSLSLFSLFNSFKMNNFQKFVTISKKNTLIIFMNLLSLSGFPPLLMFFPKLIIIMSMLNTSIILSIMLMMASLVSMYSYLSMVWPIILAPNLSSKSIYLNIPLMYSPMLFSMMIPFSSFLLIIYISPLLF